jgi:predicted cupin superfamily sugar epimerase
VRDAEVMNYRILYSMNNQEKINQIIKYLDLQSHPEGGFYKETYRSDRTMNPTHSGLEMDGERNFATSIYFLLVSGNFSAFHRIKQDEIWHFYDGAPVCLHVIGFGGVYQKVKIGRDFSKGEVPQYVVKAGDWFASEVSEGGEYSLTGCTVSPGFDFRDFELAIGSELTKEYPQYENDICRLTR